MTDQAAFDKMEKLARGLVDASEMEVSLEMDRNENGLYFNVSGPDAKYFLANKGEVLRSATQLLHYAHKRDHPDSELNVKFDAEWSQRGREDEVRQLALDAAARVDDGGGEVELEPLNPYERRIVHMTLVDRADLATASVGEGHMKSVRVAKKQAD